MNGIVTHMRVQEMPGDCRDVPLSFRWHADPDAVEAVLPLPSFRSRKAREAAARIVTHAWKHARSGDGRRISYSRGRDWWAAADYGFGYDATVPVVDALVDAGILVDHDRQKPGRPTGMQSSFRPAPELARLVLPKAPHMPDRRLIQLRDADGRPMPFRMTDRLARDLRFLQRYNARIEGVDLRLATPGVGMEIDEEAGIIRFPSWSDVFDGGEGENAVFTDMRSVYRVCNRALTLGGRMFGGWWQQVRSRDRKDKAQERGGVAPSWFVIDGERAVEADYEQLHPRLLYAMAGEAQDGNAYTIEGWKRKDAKIAFNVMLNAPTYEKALGAVAEKLEGDRKAAAAIIEAVKARHPRVAGYMHSGVGLRLQHIDSRMAQDVLQELTVDKGLPCLPVHDSFIVRESDRDTLVLAMQRALDRHTGMAPKRSVGVTNPLYR
jgi:hypothetical protein